MPWVVMHLGILEDVVSVDHIAGHSVIFEVDGLGVAQGEWPVDQRSL